MRLHARLHGNRPAAFRGRASRLYNMLATTVLRGFYRRLAQDIAHVAPPEAVVLDVGTGPGVLLAELARLRPDLRLAGVDLSPDMVAAAQRNVAPYGDRATAQVGDVGALPFADGSFDLIVSSLSLHHWDDLDSAVRELARVRRAGGAVYIYDFRFAPFEELATAAREKSLFLGPAPQRTKIRAGLPLVRRLVRFVMS
jgi:ubiquinone/menaquinone biosynthesis C-methylase UbiE